MNQLSRGQKRLIKIGGSILAVAILFLIVLSTCLVTIEPGEKGVLFHKWGDGLETEVVYDEGVHIVSPWNTMIIYDVRQKTEEMSMNVLDKTGLEVGIDISIQYKLCQTELDIYMKTLEKIIKTL